MIPAAMYNPLYATCSYLAAENVHMRHVMADKDVMLSQQAQRIHNLQQEVDSLKHDAARWAKFKSIIDAQKGELTAKQLENIIDTGNREGKQDERNAAATAIYLRNQQSKR